MVRRPVRVFSLVLLASLAAAGCVQQPLAPAATDALPEGALPGKLLVAHAAGGAPLPLPGVLPELPARTLEFEGAEPTIGVTSDGYVFIVAREDVIRSADGGATWQIVTTPLSTFPRTLDPYLYVDPVTDVVYNDQLYVGCSWLSWSADRGETWTTNPAACGVPGNDHQKIAAGKNRGPVPTLAGERVLYYAYNGIANSRIAMSYDGGLTWPVTSITNQNTLETCNGGLHGDVIADAEGILYIPKRHCEGFILLKSTDSGISWTRQLVGADAGGSACRKNADLAVDAAGGLYGVWPGKDNHLYLQTSTDQGATWREASVDASPPGVDMTTMPSVVAGSPGRIAVAYYGTSAPDAKGPDVVPKDAQWHLYVTYSLNALDAEPTFVTVQATDDPVQIGPVSTNSDCPAPEGSRNLLDFMGTALDAQGRVLVTYTDGCVDECVASLAMKDSRSRLAGYAVMQSGPSLLADVGSFTAPFAGVASG